MSSPDKTEKYFLPAVHLGPDWLTLRSLASLGLASHPVTQASLPEAGGVGQDGLRGHQAGGRPHLPGEGGAGDQEEEGGEDQSCGHGWV